MEEKKLGQKLEELSDDALENVAGGYAKPTDRIPVTPSVAVPNGVIPNGEIGFVNKRVVDAAESKVPKQNMTPTNDLAVPLKDSSVI